MAKDSKLKRELKVYVTPYRQKPSLCGWASEKCVLGYYGIEAGEKTLYSLSGSSKKHGADADDMIAVAENCFGLKGVKWDWCSISDVAAWLSMDVPVILNYYTEGGGHYAVGTELRKGLITIMDPEKGAFITKTTKEFMSDWHDFRGDYPKRQEDYITRRLIAIWDPNLLPVEPYDEPNNKHKLFIPRNLESKLK